MLVATNNPISSSSQQKPNLSKLFGTLETCEAIVCKRTDGAFSSISLLWFCWYVGGRRNIQYNWISITAVGWDGNKLSWWRDRVGLGVYDI